MPLFLLPDAISTFVRFVEAEERIK